MKRLSWVYRKTEGSGLLRFLGKVVSTEKMGVRDRDIYRDRDGSTE